MIMKHHKVVVLYHQELRAQSAHIDILYNRLAAVEASTAMIKADARDANNASVVAHTAATNAGIQAGATNESLNGLREQLNDYAKGLEQSKTVQQDLLNQHLLTIEHTFQKCSNV